MTLPQTHNNAVAYRERERRMGRMFKDGKTIQQIADEMGMSHSNVWHVLSEAGYDTGAQTVSIWSLPEDERREEFAKRAAKGARETLRVFHNDQERRRA